MVYLENTLETESCGWQCFFEWWRGYCPGQRRGIIIESHGILDGAVVGIGTDVCDAVDRGDFDV